MTSENSTASAAANMIISRLRRGSLTRTSRELSMRLAKLDLRRAAANRQPALQWSSHR